MKGPNATTKKNPTAKTKVTPKRRPHGRPTGGGGEGDNRVIDPGPGLKP